MGVQACAPQGLTGQTQENMERKVERMTNVEVLFFCPFLNFQDAPLEIKDVICIHARVLLYSVSLSTVDLFVCLVFDLHPLAGPLVDPAAGYEGSSCFPWEYLHTDENHQSLLHMKLERKTLGCAVFIQTFVSTVADFC